MTYLKGLHLIIDQPVAAKPSIGNTCGQIMFNLNITLALAFRNGDTLPSPEQATTHQKYRNYMTI